MTHNLVVARDLFDLTGEFRFYGGTLRYLHPRRQCGGRSWRRALDQARHLHPDVVRSLLQIEAHSLEIREVPGIGAKEIIGHRERRFELELLDLLDVGQKLYEKIFCGRHVQPPSSMDRVRGAERQATLPRL